MRCRRTNPLVGLAWLSLASGELRAAEIAPQILASELRRIGPAEILIADSSAYIEELSGFTLTRLPEWSFEFESGKKKLLEQLGAATLAGFGCEDLQPAISACGALLDYARKTQGQALAHVVSISTERAGEYVRMDAATRRNLEITETLRGEPSPPCFRSWTNARAAWAAGCCATGCITRCATETFWPPGTKPSARSSTRPRTCIAR